MKQIAAALLAVIVASPIWADDPEAGAVSYQRACARCHRNADQLIAGLGADYMSRDPAERAAKMRDFIGAHHFPGPEAADQIAAWLASR